MGLEHRLEIKLSQKLVLTPQLQQAIKLLQLPQLELTQALTQELTENPFLEDIQEEQQQEEQTQEEQKNEESEPPESAPEEDLLAPLESLMTFRVDDYFDERSSDGRDLGYFTPGTDAPTSFEQFVSSSPKLYEHLNWQLRLNTSDERLQTIGEAIIGNIDDNGYLRMSDEELADIYKIPVEQVREAIRLVQELDPPGIGARNLRECLLIQIKMLGLAGTLVEKIVQNNLGELEKKKYKAIAKQYGATYEDIMIAVKIIEELDPKPARNFSSHETIYVIPDVYIEKTDGEYQIILNDDGLPRLRLNNQYRKLLMNKASLTKDEKQFLEEKLRSALWLIKSLDQRNKTIYKVTKSILHFQKDFFDSGPRYIKPLNLRDVATDISMHESTVSRVTSSKYLACPHGIFSFRFFFSSSLQGNNEDISSTLVKEQIKKIISEENPKKPFSDQKIADFLNQQNITIARRTIAKYREELRIPPNSRRRRVEF
ncbi:RNA polymerase sigma-54 factor RpoN [hydrothermal vent metagenome]|uniref:RNA polymerase sigma-54 factor RpoN n=1 Tax=hydrothermal vent metagenome TaxID=652676 RepID=A0A3B1CY64_9ZZZZ